MVGAVYKWPLVAILIGLTAAQTNLLNNPSFEDETRTGTDVGNWHCAGCQGTRTDLPVDVVDGEYSYHVAGRKKKWHGARQFVQAMTMDKLYHLSGWLKLLTTDGESGPVDVDVYLTLKLKKSDGSLKWKGNRLARLKGVTVEDGWIRLVGVLHLKSSMFPDVTVVSQLLQLAMFTTGATGTAAQLNSMEYLLDNFSLKQISSDDSWKVEARESIQKNRKSDLTVKVIARRSFKGLTGAKLNLRQIESQFAIGAEASSFHLKSHENYRQRFLETFRWSSLSKDMSWKKTEFSQNYLTWKDADDGMKILLDNGKKMKCGAIHEADKLLNPDYAKNTQHPDEIYRMSLKRVDELIGRYRYKCDSWDVVNGMISSRYNHLSHIYGSDKIISELYRRARNVDYAAKLFVSDKGHLQTGANVLDTLRRVDAMRANDVPVGGIVALSEFTEKPNGALMYTILKDLARADLPIWVAGYSYPDSDISKRIAAIDDIFLAAFGTKGVDGLMFEEFWDLDSMREDTSFFEGRELTPNAAGDKLKELIAEITSYKAEEHTFDLAGSGEILMPAKPLYHGIYELTVTTAEGKVIRTQRVSLLKHQGDTTFEVYF